MGYRQTVFTTPSNTVLFERDRTSEADMLPMARHHGITPLAWSPLAGGILSGKYTREDLQDTTSEKDGSGRKGVTQAHRSAE